MDEGTTTRSSFELAHEAEEMGTSLSTSCGWDGSYVGLQCLTPHLGPSLDLAVDVLRNPTFPASEWERIHGQTLAALQAERDSAEARAYRGLLRALYGRGPPLPPADRRRRGDRRPARRATTSRRFHDRHHGPSRAACVVAGDVDPDQLAEALDDRLAGWTGPEAAPRGRPTPRAGDRPRHPAARPARGAAGGRPGRPRRPGAARPRLHRRAGPEPDPGGPVHVAAQRQAPRGEGVHLRRPEPLRLPPRCRAVLRSPPRSRPTGSPRRWRTSAARSRRWSATARRRPRRARRRPPGPDRGPGSPVRDPLGAGLAVREPVPPRPAARPPRPASPSGSTASASPRWPPPRAARSAPRRWSPSSSPTPRTSSNPCAASAGPTSRSSPTEHAAGAAIVSGTRSPGESIGGSNFGMVPGPFDPLRLVDGVEPAVQLGVASPLEADQEPVFIFRDRLDVLGGDHASVADEDEPAELEAFAQVADDFLNRGMVDAVTRPDVMSDWPARDHHHAGDHMRVPRLAVAAAAVLGEVPGPVPSKYVLVMS